MKRKPKTSSSPDLKGNLALIDLIVEDLTPTQSFVLGYLLRKKESFDYDFLINLKEKTLNQFFNETDKKPKDGDRTPVLEEKENIEKTFKTEKTNEIINKNIEKNDKLERDKILNENIIKNEKLEGKENMNGTADKNENLLGKKIILLDGKSENEEIIKCEDNSRFKNKNKIEEENIENNRMIDKKEEKGDAKIENGEDEMRLKSSFSTNKGLEPASQDVLRNNSLSKTTPAINLLKLPSYERKNPYSFHSIHKFLHKEKNENEEEYEDVNEKLSREYIKKMREEEEKEYKELMELRRQKDGEQMVCKICLEGLMEKDIFLLNNCSDIFHQECIAFYVKNEVNRKK